MNRRINLAVAAIFLISLWIQPALAQNLTYTYKVIDTNQGQCFDNNDAIDCPEVGESFYGQDAQFFDFGLFYTVSADGKTVYDGNTGLTWTKTTDFNGDGSINKSDQMTEANAAAYVNQLNSQNFGGFSDWRLPTIKELYSLIIFSGVDVSSYQGTDTTGLTPFIDTAYFDYNYGDTSAGDRVIDAQYWSATPYVYVVTNGQPCNFGVNFADGRIKCYPTNANNDPKTAYVAYCRGNTSYGTNSYVDNNDNTITDLATGLMWAKNDSGSGMIWENALAWAAQKNNENYLGYSDWRLPNAKELQTIVDYTRSPDTTDSAAIDPIFNCTEITNEAGQKDWPYFWCSTTHMSYISQTESGGDVAAYICFGRALGYMNMGGQIQLLDVHGAGAQKADYKTGDPADYPTGHGPQGDVVRIYNYVRLVRDAG